MPSIHDLKQSNFLTRQDAGRGILVTIRGFDQKNVAKEGAPEDLKYVLHFNEVEKPLVLNSTNGQIIASITKSEDFEGWIGKQIVLYDDPNVSFGGKLVGGIRVRAPRIAAPAPATAAPRPVSAPISAPVQSLAEPEGDSEVPF